MKQGVNPILPLHEYIPDGEPHIFGERIYLFGSHDKEGGLRYCAEDNYVVWSAPLSDPADWRCENVIFESSQDPSYTAGEHLDLYAPDVVQGNDGRYYLYYNPVSTAAGASAHDAIHVAVCDAPAGKYEYLGAVRNPDGTVYCPYLDGDPAVINDAGVIRLYFGWSLSLVAAEAHARGKGMEGGNRGMQAKAQADTMEGYQQAGEPSAAFKLPAPGDPLMNRKLSFLHQMLFHRTVEQTDNLEYPLMGANTIELEDDMLTVKGKMKRIVAGQFDTPRDSDFFGHAFYEASSIRKINGTYYFIYSSENSNELCYATSHYPDREFRYGGTIISNGDVGYHGRKSEDRLNQTANDHGSLECVNGQWYIFHHRQTHRSTFSRQACAEPVVFSENGSIAQVECTSMGLNGGPLKAEGTYSAAISCLLTNGRMPHITNTRLEEDIPYITNGADEIGENESYITGIKDGTRIGYKYFIFHGLVMLTVQIRGNAEGQFIVLCGPKDGNVVAVGEIQIHAANHWTEYRTQITADGVLGLYLTYRGAGSLEFKEFSLEGLNITAV